MIIKKILWSTFRIFSYGIVVINVLTFGLFLYIIAPYTSYFFFNDLRFWKYLPYFYKFYLNTLSYFQSFLSKNGSFIFSNLRLSSPPMKTPDSKLVRVVEDWPYESDSCGTCHNCCIVSKCIFNNNANNKCTTYNTLFWRFFNCGRFPINKEQLIFYKCKKYELYYIEQ